MSKADGMMYPNLNEGQAQQPPAAPSTWWTNKFCTALGLGYFLCGLITAISVSPSLILGGILQMINSLVILSIEAPLFVPCLGFIRPVGDFVDRKPLWIRVTLYGGLTLLPFLLCSITTGITIAVFFVLGAVCNLAITGIYAKVILGNKADRDAMRATAGNGGVFP